MLDCVIYVGIALKNIIYRIAVVGIGTEAEAEVTLWVEVDSEYFFSESRKTAAKSRTGRCFSDAAFLVGDSNNFSHN